MKSVNTINLLLIERDEVGQEAFKQLIQEEELNCRYTILASMVEATALLAEKTFDIVIVSYELSNSSNVDILNKLKSTIAILLIEPGHEEIIANALKAGMHGYLIKDESYKCFKLLPAILSKTLEQRKNQQILQSIFDDVPVTVHVLDANYNIKLVNREWERVFGWKLEEVRGHNILKVLSLNKQTDDTTPNYWPSPTSGWRDFKVINREEQLLDMTWSINRLPTGDIVGIGRNGTERKQTEEALRQSEERFRQFVSSISDHIYVTEVTKKGDTINHYISPNVDDLTGYPSETFIHNWSLWTSLVIHPDDREAAAHQAMQLKAGQSSKMEYRLIRADGEIIWVRDSARVEHNGDSKIVYGVVSDITEYKQLEAALKAERTSLAHRIEARTVELRAANADLGRALKAKDEFLATMSHELRTPLSAILGMSEILQEQVYGPLNQKQSDYIKIVEDSGRHLLSLINDILDLSKIQANKLKLELGPVYLESLCKNSLRLVKQAAHQKQIRLNFEYDHVVQTFFADERRVLQILVNLLSNAVKFTPAGGSVGLKVVGDVKQQLVNFIVWDTGIGIAEEDRRKLFKPFVQIDSSLSRQYEGTGLGLSLVYTLSQLQGGTVSVKSKINEGSQFTVSLPWQPDRNEANDQTPSSHAMTSRIQPEASVASAEPRATILLAEDNPANAEVVSNYLLTKGYNIILARDGNEVIEKTELERPDLILMDIQMPELNGIEAIQQIRADSDLSSIPVVVLTALAMPGDRQRCLDAGADEYLSKPVSLKELATVLKSFLQEN